ncbi:MAG: MFS transporter [Acidimicrobiia bacterium]|nr:MAG: MFS transporter [Acidimicrobiia bacterium]
MGNGSPPRFGVLTPVLPLFVGLAFLMVGNGLVGSLIGVRADLDGFATVVIGVVMSMYYVGFLVGSLTIPRWLVSVGHIRVFAGLAALASATALTYSLLVAPVAWGVLRFVFGLCMSGLYVTVESWLNERASNETRGRLLSVYMLVVTLGLGTGQLLLGVASPAGSTLFILVGILISLAVVPVAMIRIPTPRDVIPVKLSLGGLWRTAPLGVLAVAVAGAAGSSVIALGAVYATKIGMDPALVGAFVAASMVGGALAQYPLGRLSDRVPRRRVILSMAALAIMVAVAGILVEPGSALQFLVIGAYGGLAFPMYSVAVSQINDSMPGDQLVVAAAGIVFVFGVGSVVGPFAVAVLMELLEPVGYFWGLGIYFVPLVVYAFVRIIFKERPTQREFVSLPPRSSTAAALLAEPSDVGGPSAGARSGHDGE